MGIGSFQDLGVVLPSPAAACLHRGCKCWTVSGRERSRLISGSFGLGSGLELMLPAVAS